jgi:hypothetical protein
VHGRRSTGRAVRRLIAPGVVIWLAVTMGCGSSRSRAADGVCSELYARGLTGCTELCLPFGVLHFGVEVLADGTATWSCQCMPGEPSDQQDRSPDEVASAPVSVNGTADGGGAVATGRTTPAGPAAPPVDPASAPTRGPSSPFTTRL